MTPEENAHVKTLTGRKEIFEHVVAHLRKQNCKSVLPAPQSSCAYHGPGGLMCAVGCLIADDEYNPVYEGNDVDQLCDPGLFIDAPGISVSMLERLGPHIDMLTHLQNLHDGFANSLECDRFFAVDGLGISAAGEKALKHVRSRFMID